MSAAILELPMAWRVRWVDTEGRERVSVYHGDSEPWLVTLAVATWNDDFDEFIGDPERVVRRV